MAEKTEEVLPHVSAVLRATIKRQAEQFEKKERALRLARIKLAQRQKEQEAKPSKGQLTPEEKLLRAIFGEPIEPSETNEADEGIRNVSSDDIDPNRSDATTDEDELIAILGSTVETYLSNVTNQGDNDAFQLGFDTAEDQFEEFFLWLDPAVIAVTQLNNSLSKGVIEFSKRLDKLEANENV